MHSVPQPSVVLVLDLGDTELVVNEANGVVHRGSLTAGITTGAVRVQGSGVECVQVRLSPLVAGSVLGVAPSDLELGVVALDDVWGADAERLRSRLHDASWRERFSVVDSVLSRRHSTGSRVDPETAHAWNLIVRSRGRLRVDDLVDETGWSRKRLWLRFRDQIGLPPKHAALLARFDDAVHRLAAGVGAARVAAEGGYADQSHLHRDVVRFTGDTPHVIARSPWLSVDDVAWPDVAGK